jgi:predicted nucleotidyltransferase
MNFFQTNFDAIRLAYKPIFDALERALQKFDVDYYLIGAQSRDVWTNHLDIKKKQTRDIDYYVFINDKNTWDKLNSYLIEIEKFERDNDQPYRFYFAGLNMDLLPFGGIEENEEIAFDNPPMKISVYGSKAVTQNAAVIHGKYNVITLPGLCILKLIALNEKPDRSKDWQDILLILHNYFNITGYELFEGPYEDLFDNYFETNIAAARMLGRHMQKIIQNNITLRNKILHTLHGKLMNFSFQDIERMYELNDSKVLQIETLRLVVELIRGINDISN